jgi:hypothetical protein
MSACEDPQLSACCSLAGDDLTVMRPSTVGSPHLMRKGSGNYAATGTAKCQDPKEDFIALSPRRVRCKPIR